MEEEIKKIIDELRPYLLEDGGNIEFIRLEDNYVYIKLTGACANCAMLDVTLKDGIEAMIKDEVPTVETVINVE